MFAKAISTPRPKASMRTELAYQLAKRSRELKLDVEKMMRGQIPVPDVWRETEASMRNWFILRSYRNGGREVWDVGADDKVHRLLKAMEMEGFLRARFTSSGGTLCEIRLTEAGMEEGQVLNALDQFKEAT
jgi:hypothetical protein